MDFRTRILTHSHPHPHQHFYDSPFLMFVLNVLRILFAAISGCASDQKWLKAIKIDRNARNQPVLEKFSSAPQNH